ncbi:hypothetical protein OCU04_000762 [Sclerotinia nivalis]|uniref:Sulfatase N-terminal domain-containing protein n=1 Tax=Sclerotinia nivalis TaxID=352851 RepID=A0A9X0AWT7_9HELO|nr:hypothetical protein OCU04_000762 [Sclerotinia nivalis]
MCNLRNDEGRWESWASMRTEEHDETGIINSILNLKPFSHLHMTSLELPNFFIIIVDDLGFSDLSCFGGVIQAPNIDKIAQAEICFTDFQAAAACMVAIIYFISYLTISNSRCNTHQYSVLFGICI